MARMLSCAYCGTPLHPYMDTIVRFAAQPGATFCDRCESIARRNLTPRRHIAPIRHRAAPRRTDRRTAAHIAVLVALVLLSIGAALAIIAWASTTRP